MALSKPIAAPRAIAGRDTRFTTPPCNLEGRLITRSGRPARVALVHEWFDHYYGAERVAREILHCFPKADIFTLVDIMPPEERGFLAGRRIATSFIQRLPFADPHFRRYLPLFPVAIEQFDLAGYDLVLSSNHAVAKGVLTSPNQVHVSYVHAPMRYAWEYQHEYLRQSGLGRGLRGIVTRYLLHRLRIWDCRTANSVDHFIANSNFIARRIRKIYGRDSAVTYPPVEVDRFKLRADKDEYFLAASRFVPYKHTETIVEAFTQLPDCKLVVVGDGPGLRRAQAIATPNVNFVGVLPFAELHEHMQAARALVFAAEEDFGITPVEAQACGTPVIAYGSGGALETVRDLDEPRPTGLLFEEQTADGIAAAIRRFQREGHAISPHDCRRNALAFATHRFRAEFTHEVATAWLRHGGRLEAEMAAAAD